MSDLITELRALAQRMAAAGETDAPATVSLAAEEIERLRSEIEMRKLQVIGAAKVMQEEKNDNAKLREERDQLKAVFSGSVDDLIERISAAKQSIQCEDGAGSFVSVGAINNAISHLRKAVNDPPGCIAQHDAEVIERETKRCIESVEAEPEYPDEAPPELMKYINQCIENKDVEHMLHMMRMSVRLTKSEIINRMRGLETQQAKEVQS